MTPRHFVVTLASGASQPLTTDKSIIGFYVTVQPFFDNGGPAYLGGRDATNTQVVSADNYGITLPSPVGGVPCAPYPIDPWNQGLRVNLAEIEIIGTSGDSFSVMYWA